MTMFAGMDVGGKRTAVCILDDARWTPPKTSGQIGVELIHLVMSQGDRGHGEGNARIF